ncbi:hypothetical protein C3513_26185 [Salmonella enterica]|nr:hypothetical protein [Salmonella enterica]
MWIIAMEMPMPYIQPLVNPDPCMLKPAPCPPPKPPCPLPIRDCPSSAPTSPPEPVLMIMAIFT